MDRTTRHLLPTLGTTQELFWKVEREFRRTVHAPNLVHKADHFYNFCVTAHALRQYFLKETDEWKTESGKKRESQWNQLDALCIIRDVANLTKHWRLDIPPPGGREVDRVRSDTSGMVDAYVTLDGRLVLDQREVPTLVVRTESGGKHEVVKLAYDVVNYWREFITSEGAIPLGPQPWEDLTGESGRAHAPKNRART